MLLQISLVLCKTYMIKTFYADEYITSDFNPISLPRLGPKSLGHVFQIAHPEDDSKVSFLKLACVPGMKTIPEVVLDATREQNKVTYFPFNELLDNERFQIIRYEDGHLIVRDEECVTYNREREFFYTANCLPKYREQLFAFEEALCTINPNFVPLEYFIDQPPTARIPSVKFA